LAYAVVIGDIERVLVAGPGQADAGTEDSEAAGCAAVEFA
jgi:hypothetical protein